MTEENTKPPVVARVVVRRKFHHVLVRQWGNHYEPEWKEIEGEIVIEKLDDNISHVIRNEKLDRSALYVALDAMVDTYGKNKGSLTFTGTQTIRCAEHFRLVQIDEYKFEVRLFDAAKMWGDKHD